MAYTTVNDPSAQFQIALYTGSSSSVSPTFTGNANLQPDMMWIKSRSGATNNNIYDSSRGSTERLYPNLDSQVDTVSGMAFNSDGFTTGTNSVGDINVNGSTYVGWGWKANGGTTANNASGSITSTTQANTTAGFSVVTYTGNGVNGATVGHSLSTIPQMIIVKRRDATANWMVYHEAMGPTKAMFLDLTAASDTDAGYWSNTAPTTGIFNLGTNSKGNSNGGTYVAYCFANTKGYSSFGSYSGSGGSAGPFVFLGFKPAFVMIKKVNSAEDWGMVDNKRSSTNGFNVIDRFLYANQSYAEATTQTPADLLSNGFKSRNSDGKWNTDGSQYIYMAFASSPFTTSHGVPTTAR
jgi:hypothetical protein